jgi:sugar fermentation stimulation protein A
MRLFRNDREAVFVSRPNRFLILARGTDGQDADGNGAGEELYCHCPNPGRLIEFAFPGERLILERGTDTPERAGASRRTAWTAAAVYHNGAVAPLYASRANGAAAELALAAIIPHIVLLRPEYPIGGSRFDFYAEDRGGGRHLIEVKACSLVEYETAMFPDAPSSRALKHLEELAALSREGYQTHVLFMILHGSPTRFIPNLHTDPAFAAALSRRGAAADAADAAKAAANGAPEAGRVAVHAALIRCNAAGEAALVTAAVPVDLSHGELAERNSGNYLFVLELPESRDIETGALGIIHFERGWYVYAGSAGKNLSQRIARHLRKIRKKKHWHIDYLTPFAEKLKALPLRSYRNLECDLARDLGRIGGAAIPRFGCSDCDCGRSGGSHLAYFKTPPLENRDFINLLLRYRHGEALARQEDASIDN